MKIIILTFVVLSLTLSAFADDKKKFDPSDLQTLKDAKAVYVEKAEKEVDVAMIGELNKWGRWKVVASDSEADLIVKLRVSGSAAWGVGHVQAFILDAK